MADGTLHGVNLTGWLSLEPWVTPELFAEAGALDEDALLKGLARATTPRSSVATATPSSRGTTL